MQFNLTWQKILSGAKTETRRLVKDGDCFTTALAQVVIGKDVGRVIHTVPAPASVLTPRTKIYSVMNGERTVYAVGKTYAVQPGRTLPAIYWRYSDMTGTGYEVLQQPYSPELANWGWKQVRIRITSIRREDVRNISAEDAIAEGFGSRQEFMLTWLALHDKQALPIYRDWSMPRGEFTGPVAYVKARPAERYEAWALTFELVNTGS